MSVKNECFPKTKFILGGAQIGNDYMNFKRLNIEKFFTQKLFLNNFTYIDTAFNYSKSHEKISNLNAKKNINIMTKLDYSKNNNRSKYFKENFYLNFYKSLINLNQNKVDTLLIHNYSDFKDNSSQIIEIFNKLQDLNLINNSEYNLLPKRTDLHYEEF